MSSHLEHTTECVSADPHGLGAAAPLSRRELRRAIDRIFPLASEFDAFLIDFFPAVYRQFSVGMDRTARVNLLFQMTPQAEICLRLRQEFPTEVSQAEIASAVCASLGYAPPRIRYTVVLVGHLNDLDPAKLKALVEQLRNHTCDVELTLEQIRQGSVILVCEGSESGFTRLYEDFSTGKLQDLLGFPLSDIVLNVAAIPAEASDAVSHLWPTLYEAPRVPNRPSLPTMTLRASSPPPRPAFPGGAGVTLHLDPVGAKCESIGRSSSQSEAAQVHPEIAALRPHGRWIALGTLVTILAIVLCLGATTRWLPSTQYAARSHVTDDRVESPARIASLPMMSAREPAQALEPAPAPESAISPSPLPSSPPAPRRAYPAPLANKSASAKSVASASLRRQPKTYRDFQIDGVEGVAKAAILTCARAILEPLPLPIGSLISLEHIGSRWFVMPHSSVRNHHLDLQDCLRDKLAAVSGQQLPKSVQIRVIPGKRSDASKPSP